MSKHPNCLCETGCGRWARYTALDPETSKIVHVCDRCELEWAKLAERKTVTQWDLAVLAAEKLEL